MTNDKPTSLTYEMKFKADKMSPLKKWTTFNLASTATTTSTLGSGITSTYDQVGMEWLKRVIDAAQTEFVYSKVCQQEVIPKGSDKINIPVMPVYAAQSWETTGEEIAAGSEIVWSSIDPVGTKSATAIWKTYGATVSNKMLQTVNVPYVDHVRKKLKYQELITIDTTVRDTLVGKHGLYSATANTATPMSDSVPGLQTIFGGDAVNTSNTLDAGDILTPEMISKAKMLLEAKEGYFWSSNVWTQSAVPKNPWKDENDFVLVISPQQEASLRQETQFTNAAEFGSDKVVLSGQIAEYLGVKIVKSANVPSFVSGGAVRVQGANVSTDVSGHVCTMFKAGMCGAVGWSQKPRVNIFPYPSALQTRMTLEMGFGATEVHPDAMVNIIVADQ